MKHVNPTVVFQEVPDETSLAINITGCTVRCPQCHSRYLWEDIGEPLNTDTMDDMILQNRGITAVLLMGGDAHLMRLRHLMKHVRFYYPDLRIAWYSGRTVNDPSAVQGLLGDVVNLCDYVKFGPYREAQGGLASRTTNQRMYHRRGNVWQDITERFWDVR